MGFLGWFIFILFIALIGLGIYAYPQFFGKVVSDVGNKIGKVTEPQPVTSGTNLGKPGCGTDNDCARLEACLDTNKANICKCHTTGDCIK